MTNITDDIAKLAADAQALQAERDTLAQKLVDAQAALAAAQAPPPITRVVLGPLMPAEPVSGIVQIPFTAPLGMINAEILLGSTVLARATPDSLGKGIFATDTTLAPNGLVNPMALSWDVLAGNPQNVAVVHQSDPALFSLQILNAAAPASYIDVKRDYGAKGDGIADDQTPLALAFKVAQAQGLPVYIPPGVYLHSSVLAASGITVFGAGEASVLKALNPASGSIFLTGTNPALYGVKIDGSATSRGVFNEMNGVTIDHATGFKVENVHVVNSMAAGIMDWGGSNGYIGHNYVEHSFADAIHNTAGAHDVT